MAKGRHTKKNIWDEAGKLKLVRDGEAIDPGANYFILMLDQMGLKTTWSCEGHPGGFYIMFLAPYESAQDIKKAGFFSVEIEGEEYWSIRRYDPHGFGEPERVDALRWASEAWEKHFGPLDLDEAELIGERKQ